MGVFVVHPRSRSRLLSVDVAERDVVGGRKVCGWRFAGFLAVDVAEGLGHLS